MVTLDEQPPPEPPDMDMLVSTLPAVFRRINDMTGGAQDSLTIGNVSPSSFRALETARNRHRQRQHRKRRLFYDPATARVVITVPSTLHIKLHVRLYECILYEIRDMGRHRQWTSCYGETCYAEDGGGGQVDCRSAGSPVARWGGGTVGWPTLVIEAGVSSSMSSLETKMQWWFAASRHRVKVVILMRMHVEQGTIDIEMWRDMSGSEPSCHQSISIAWAGPRPVLSMVSQDRTPPHFNVTGGPLVLFFEELFLRAPVATDGEHDIVVVDNSLQEVASMVWQFV